MKTRNSPHHPRWLAILLAFSAAHRLLANPNGMVIKVGSASTQTSGSQLTVNTSALTVLNWASFDIKKGETTTFLQPSANSVVFNSIGDANPSQIFGSLNANGTVILANSHGFYFGPDSYVNIGGNFVATTAPLPPDAGSSGSWSFTGAPPLASIVNYGQITTGKGHSLFLIAENIDNQGTLTAPGGNIGMYGAQNVLVTEQADGRGLSANVKLPAGSVNNSGQIVADAGSIALNAKVVNQNGLIQADSVHSENGSIELVASDQLTLGAQSQIIAQGDGSTTGSPGGNVVLKSGGSFSDAIGSKITTAGGTAGGNGGDVEVSAPNILSLNSAMDAGAQFGSSAGHFSLDPANITLGTSGTGSAGNGTVGSSSGSGTLQLNVNTAFANKNFSTITLEATGNITLAAGTTWNLSHSTGENSGQLTLQAGGNIIFGNNAQITDANNWSVNLQAGVDFTTGNVQSGVGSIYLNGSSTGKLNGTVQTFGGNINMTAGQDILVGIGAIRTTGGGSIDLNAMAGNINAGTANGGYQFGIFGYSVSSTLGQIATTAGGDVTLQAGNTITSTPTVPFGQPPGASGAYGAGNVTVLAGNQILGNYTVANGTGNLLAGVTVQNGAVTQISNPTADIGSSTRPISLSLINGSWNAWAADDVFVAEVRNPDGTFNNNAQTVPLGTYSGNVGTPAVPPKSSFLFDYGATAGASFWAGDAITLAGNNLPRVLGANQGMPPVYPPVLNLEAGAGGITVDNPIILFPSAQGNLNITTTGGGNVTGAFSQGTLTGITMSDSGLPGYATFALGHALTPLHINDPHPVTVNVSGDIDSFGLVVPTFAQVGVTGNTYNFGFLGQNLSKNETTAINVAGNITYRGDISSVALTTPFPAVFFNSHRNADPSILSKIQYDPTTHTLTFIGQMTSADLAFLLSPTQIVVDQYGYPVVGPNGPVTKPISLTADQLAAVQQLYTASQNATLGDQGLLLAGPGHFNVTAQNIDLGISGGIRVLGPDAALAAITPYGADLAIHTTGNLAMTSSKIANEGLDGDLQLTVGKTLDVGGQFSTFGDPNAAKGIYTTSGGDISITATDNVNVDGSRIATYDGGNINIRSLTGDVNAGSGGTGYVSMSGLELNPKTGQLVAIPATIAGSGILATTLPHSHAHLGNITIDTPEGSINASKGGIIQIALNGANAQNNFINLNAGQNINASGSGIIGANLQVNATGDITGIFVGTGSIDVASHANVSITAFGGGNVSVSAAGTVSGTVISSGAANVSGESITANLVSQSVSTSGNTTTSAIGVPASAVSHQDARVADDASTMASKTETASDDDEKKKHNKPIALTQKAGRVTVLAQNRKNP